MPLGTFDTDCQMRIVGTQSVWSRFACGRPPEVFWLESISVGSGRVLAGLPVQTRPEANPLNGRQTSTQPVQL